MDDERLKQNLAVGIAAHRKRIGLTQTGLSRMISYSDKSVSKWERAEGLPDIPTLVLLSEIFRITPNDLIFGNGAAPEKLLSAKQRLLITMMAMGLVWLVAAVAFLVLKIIFPHALLLGRVFLYALPATCVVGVVFTSLWWGLWLQELAISALVWSAALCLDISMPFLHIKLVYLVAGVLQVLVVLWFIMKRTRKK